MRSALKTLALTLAALIAIDIAVALVLAGPAPAGLKRFFDYGRSAPGKIAQWKADPTLPGNLLEVAWLPGQVAQSAERFAVEDPKAPPVVRTYGMSFVNQITAAARAMAPDLVVDGMGGPGASPNFTFAAFLADRANRRAGDIVVLGILSSSVPGLSSFSNRVWVFEQPAPFTYPVYWPDGAGPGLIPKEPLIRSLEDELRLTNDQELRRAWETQLHDEDGLYTRAAFGAPWLDVSPLARLVRRAAAVRAVSARETALLNGDAYPYRDVLRRMVVEFARVARVDGQIPVVMLIQGRDPADPDLKEILTQTMAAQNISSFATADIQSANDPRAFLPDGHYTAKVNERYGAAFLSLLARAGM